MSSKIIKLLHFSGEAKGLFSVIKFTADGIVGGAQISILQVSLACQTRVSPHVRLFHLNIIVFFCFSKSCSPLVKTRKQSQRNDSDNLLSYM